MYYVYILISIKDRNFYVGYTADIEKRVERHKSGLVKSTKYRLPIKLICYEVYFNSTDARKREMYLKSSDARKEMRIRFRKTLKNI